MWPSLSIRAIFLFILFSAVPTALFSQGSLLLRQSAVPDHPFTVVGAGGSVLGLQNGQFELWQNPVKILQDFHITAHLQSYGTPLEMNSMPATIEVKPAETVITLSHAAIVVREHLLVDRTGKLRKTAALAIFEIYATRPGEIVFSFKPSMEYEWPASNFGNPSGSWHDLSSGGGYILTTDNPQLFGTVSIPGARPGAIPPYQERSRMQPLELHLLFDPKVDNGRMYPLLAAVSNLPKPVTRTDQEIFLRDVLSEQKEVPELIAANTSYYEDFFQRTLQLTTPNREFNDAFRWAEVSIDQSRIQSTEGAGLAAGWSTSDDTARPGFGWFFGRDTLWSLYAVNSYGDFALSQSAMDFLQRHQRFDGKMMHEYSQTAAMVNWNNMPYLYASADSTPLFLMQMRDYVRSSGDREYLSRCWGNVRRAYSFIQAHRENGLYSNTAGTGWVEEWPGALPHQEIYLAALDVQASEAIAELARWMHDESLAAEAETDAQREKKQIATYRQADGWYAFSRNDQHRFDATKTIFPAVAWWENQSSLPQAEAMLSSWAGSEFSVDWGVRSVSSAASIYDPISYHHGSVWPLYSGWVGVAEFRTGHTLQALERTWQALELDRIQDLGATTEVISGEFLEPLARSSSHQLWSSAMAIELVTRGMLGLETDAIGHTLVVNPHLPASWDHVEADNVRIGNDRYKMTMTRDGQYLKIIANSDHSTVLCLTQKTASEACASAPAKEHRLTVMLPAVEVDFKPELPAEGSRSSMLHFLKQEESAHSLKLSLEGMAGSTEILDVRRNLASATINVEGGDLANDKLFIHFPAGKGYMPQEVTLHW